VRGRALFLFRLGKGVPYLDAEMQGDSVFKCTQSSLGMVERKIFTFVFLVLFLCLFYKPLVWQT
jgi:hypothetical protein